MLRKLTWFVTALIYWAVVVYFLRSASPVHFDGGGPMPSFEWGHLPTPSLSEYTRAQHYYDLVFSLPYYVAGLVITVTGCVAAPFLLKWQRRSSERTFRTSAGATLILLAVLAMVSDMGTLLRFWNGPVFLLQPHFDPHTIGPLAKTFLPASLLSGAVAVAQRRLSSRD